MKRVLVTGASGFLGRHAIPHLQSRGYEVHALARQKQEKLPGVVWHQRDLLSDLGPLEIVRWVRPTHLLHLAWCADPVDFWHTPDNLHWLHATNRLVEAFTKYEGQRVVGVGSCAEYEWADDTYCHELSSPTNPATLYGHAKLTAGRRLETLAAAGQVSSAWARLFFLYGPGAHERRLPGSVIGPLLEGLPAPCSSGVQIRDYMFIDDAAAAIVATLDSAVEGAVNIASGEPVRIIDMLKGVASILDCEHLLQVGAVADSMTNNPQRLVADVTRLRDEVRFTPSVTLEQGLQRTVDWCGAGHRQVA